MNRVVITTLVGVALTASALCARQQQIQRGTIKSVDAAKGTITITADGRDHDLAVTPETRVGDANNRMLAPLFPWAEIKAGATVQFRAEDRGGRAVLFGLKIGGGPPG